MGKLIDDGDALVGSFTLRKQTGTFLMLSTGIKKVPKNIELTFDVASGVGAGGSASATLAPHDDSSSGNVSDILGSEQTSAPATGKYVCIRANVQGNSQISQAGWMSSGALPGASLQADRYFAVNQAVLSAQVASGTVTPSASVSGTNVTLSNTDNGIAVTSTGGGSAAGTVSAEATQAGYVEQGIIGTYNFSMAQQQTSASSFISGVNLQPPASGTRSFSITVPNGENDTVTFTFVVDSNGNVVVE